MDDRSPNQFESNRTWAWCVGALVVVLNFWYDWHHPLGYLFGRYHFGGNQAASMTRHEHGFDSSR